MMRAKTKSNIFIRLTSSNTTTGEDEDENKESYTHITEANWRATNCPVRREDKEAT